MPIAPPPPAKRRKSQGLTQAYQLRYLAHALAMRFACDPSIDAEDFERARIFTNAVAAWAKADDQVRIQRGKPLPGAYRPGERKRGGRTSSKSKHTLWGPEAAPLKASET